MKVPGYVHTYPLRLERLGGGKTKLVIFLPLTLNKEVLIRGPGQTGITLEDDCDPHPRHDQIGEISPCLTPESDDSINDFECTGHLPSSLGLKSNEPRFRVSDTRKVSFRGP